MKDRCMNWNWMFPVSYEDLVMMTEQTVDLKDFLLVEIISFSIKIEVD